MTAAPRVVVAFDVDGTLTRRDCVVPFLRVAAGTARLVWTCARTPVRTAAALARRDRDALKALAAGSLRGRSVEEIAELGRRFLNEHVIGWLRDDAVARFAWHRNEGHQIVLVSASLRPYLAPLAEHLGAAAVLCCELETSEGRYTGRLDGPNCRGAEKVRRLRAWLGDDPAELWAYGDSSGDRELLAVADHPFLVRNVTLDPRP